MCLQPRRQWLAPRLAAEGCSAISKTHFFRQTPHYLYLGLRGLSILLPAGTWCSGCWGLLIPRSHIEAPFIWSCAILILMFVILQVNATKHFYQRGSTKPGENRVVGHVCKVLKHKNAYSRGEKAISRIDKHCCFCHRVSDRAGRHAFRNKATALWCPASTISSLGRLADLGNPTSTQSHCSFTASAILK